MQIDKLKTNMQVQTLLNLIDTLRRNISLHVDSALKSTAGDSLTILEYEKTKRQTMISNYSRAAQLFEYYIPPRISLTWMLFSLAFMIRRSNDSLIYYSFESVNYINYNNGSAATLL